MVDAANPHHPEQMAEVQRVLQEIGADDVPQLLVFNKLDALETGAAAPAAERRVRARWRRRCPASSSAPTPARACRHCGAELRTE